MESMERLGLRTEETAFKMDNISGNEDN